MEIKNHNKSLWSEEKPLFSRFQSNADRKLFTLSRPSSLEQPELCSLWPNWLCSVWTCTFMNLLTKTDAKLIRLQASTHSLMVFSLCKSKDIGGQFQLGISTFARSQNQSTTSEEVPHKKSGAEKKRSRKKQSTKNYPFCALFFYCLVLFCFTFLCWASSDAVKSQWSPVYDSELYFSRNFENSANSPRYPRSQRFLVNLGDVSDNRSF